jgi:hypothetical protein
LTSVPSGCVFEAGPIALVRGDDALAAATALEAHRNAKDERPGPRMESRHCVLDDEG